MPDIDQRLVDIAAMSPAELRAAWRDAYRNPAPDISPDLLARGIAHRIQERAYGGLSPSVVKEIGRLRKRLERGGEVVQSNEISLKAGTRLVRSWNGTTYHVLVNDDGFEFDGRQYRSLSQIAREITGAHWSGPRFFGLKKRTYAELKQWPAI